MTVDCVLLKDSSLVLAVGLGARNQFLSLSHSTTKTLPPCQMLVIYPVFYFSSIYILPRDHQKWFRSNSLLNRTSRT